MAKLCGVRLNPNGKVYSFSYTNQKISEGDIVVVETQHGLKLGEIVTMTPEDNEIKEGTKSVVRVATDKDFAMESENLELAKKAFVTCKEKIDEMGLEMKLFKAEYSLDRSKIMFQYMSDQRIDFRELVKELVPALRTRIEMIQVGPREHAKFVGGLGMCGRQFCCQGFMTSFEPVTIKMAKDQGLTSNPAKYSGNCGKLLCCIRHEECAYEYAQGIMPKNGAIVVTPDGIGKTIVANMLKETCSVKVGTEQDFEIKSYNVSDIRTPTEEERNEYLAAKKREREEMEQHREEIRAELQESEEKNRGETSERSDRRPPRADGERKQSRKPRTHAEGDSAQKKQRDGKAFKNRKNRNRVNGEKRNKTEKTE